MKSLSTPATKNRPARRWLAVIGASLVLLTWLAGASTSSGLPIEAGEDGTPGTILTPRVYLPFVVQGQAPRLPLYRLTVDPADLEWLYEEANRWTYETVPAVFGHENAQYDVRVRFRGGTTRYLPKKSWKVDFPAATPFQGQRELNLNAQYTDKSLLREALSYDLFERVGLPVPRTQYVRLEVNGEYMGLFLQVEQIDQRYLDRVGWDPNGNLYKGDYGGNFDWGVDYEASYVKKTNREDSHDDIIAFLRVLNLTPEADLPPALAARLDVGQYLDWVAVQILLGSYEWLEKNYYVYRPLQAEQWTLIPWDLDLTLGHNWGANGILDQDISWDNPIDSGTRESPKADGIWNQLITKVLANQDFRFVYCRRLRELMNDEFSEALMYQRIDAFYAPIVPAAEADTQKWGTNQEFHAGPAELKTYVTNRLAWLSGQMPGYCPEAGPMPLVNELMSDNRTTLADEAGEHEPWIELYNPGWASFDAGGMVLRKKVTGTLALQWTLPHGTVIPPRGFLLVWADGEPEQGPLHAGFRLDPGGNTVALVDKAVHGGETVDEGTCGALAPDLSWGRLDDGDQDWITFTVTATTPGWSNLGRPPLVTATAHAPVEPLGGQPVTVTALVTDEVAGPSVTLHWSADGVDHTGPMGDEGGGRYSATIPGYADGTVVTYHVRAEDAVGLVSVDPPRAPAWPYHYIVGFQRPPLYLNELLPINRGTLDDEAGGSDDWFEIYNAGATAVDLGGMYLTDAIENSTKWQIPPGVTAPPGGYVLFWADDEPEQGATHVGFKLDGDGERLALYAGPEHYNGLIDEVYYGPQTPDPLLQGSDRSWGRYPDGEASWGHLIPTPGQANRQPPPFISRLGHSPRNPQASQSVDVTANIQDEGETISATLYYSAGLEWVAVPLQPGAEGLYNAPIPPQGDGVVVAYYALARDDWGETTVYPGGAPTVTYGYRAGYAPPPLYINEFLASNDAVNQDEWGEYEDWVELYHAGDAPLDVGGLYLTDDLGRPTRWRIPDGTTIPLSGTIVSPGGFLLIWTDDDGTDGPLHTGFKLDKDGEEIGLFYPLAGGLGEGSAVVALIDQVVFGPQATDVSSGRSPDGGASWRIFPSPTPERSNISY